MLLLGSKLNYDQNQRIFIFLQTHSYIYENKLHACKNNNNNSKTRKLTKKYSNYLFLFAPLCADSLKLCIFQ